MVRCRRRYCLRTSSSLPLAVRLDVLVVRYDIAVACNSTVFAIARAIASRAARGARAPGAPTASARHR